jgi:hypothetical protein
VIALGATVRKILLVGGWGEEEDVLVPVPLASTELYDPATNRFARPGSIATLKVARGSHNCNRHSFRA